MFLLEASANIPTISVQSVHVDIVADISKSDWWRPTWIFFLHIYIHYHVHVEFIVWNVTTVTKFYFLICSTLRLIWDGHKNLITTSKLLCEALYLCISYLMPSPYTPIWMNWIEWISMNSDPITPPWRGGGGCCLTPRRFWVWIP